MMLKIWFMYDNHCFAKIIPGSRDEMIEQAKRLFAEDGYGSIFVRDESEASLNTLTLDGGVNGERGVKNEDIERWVDQVKIEMDFRHRMDA